MNNKDVRISIATKIKNARKEANLNQSQLGSRVFMDKTTICCIETGKSGVSSDRLFDFAKALNKPIIYFLSDIS